MKPQVGQPPQIDIKKTTPIVCDSCSNDVFISAMKFRKVSKILAGMPDDQIIPVQVFICTSCGAIPSDFDLDI
jgi:DNA-directed RNA polymerase subunit RPC12/RpoP